MRLPIEPLPPLDPGIAQDLYDIQEPAAIAPSKRVTERTLPPLVTYPPKQGGKKAAGTAEAPVAPTEDRRSGEDRRQADRREGEQPHLLDTRTGHDRRKGPRRKDDPVTAVDQEV